MLQECIPVGNDIVLIPIEALVCQSCGERFYDRTTQRRLNWKTILAGSQAPLRAVGKVLELVSG